MSKPAVLIASLLLCSLPALAQSKASTTPKSIRFQGVPQFTQEELLAAANLTPGARLSPSEVRAHAKQLNDTGFFQVVKFSSDAKGLLFSLTASSPLFPMHLDNLPLKPGKELDEKLHQRFPLYHGQLPANGSVVEGIRQSFEEMLAAEGVKASVKAAPMSGLGPQKITAMNFIIATPQVRIGSIRLTGVSAGMQAKANGLVASQTGNGFDTENTAVGLKHAFEDLYQDDGYAAAQVDVSQIDPPEVSGKSSDLSVDVPFAVTIKEGGLYKLGSINYPADALVPRANVAKVMSKFQAGSGRPLDLFLLGVRDAYHAKGYMECSVIPHAFLSEETHIVNYSLNIVPGPLYKMGAVQFDGATGVTATKLARLWKLTQGQAFYESYVSNFAARAQKQDRSLAKWLQTVVTTYDVKADAATHQVNCVFHFAKAT